MKSAFTMTQDNESTETKKKRYAIVGTGHRSGLYTRALHEDYNGIAELAAYCDTNAVRMDYWKKKYASGSAHIRTYSPEAFGKMIEECRIDTVIVTTMDRTHHDYICAAMRAGCDVISEKPMTIDGEKCNVILDTIKDTGRQLRVTFNYRYAPRNSRVKEFLLSGRLGKVLSVHFEWFLDTKHGADYFRRWHRDKSNSGGLMVHKSTHHFDLVNWWLQAVPASVCAMGGLQYYGRKNAEDRGVKEFYKRGSEGDIACRDPFALDMRLEADLKGLYLEAEHLDGYLRDQSVFDSGITTEDDVGVLVHYCNNAVMTYHLTAYSPKEGFRVVFNGTQGRLEYDVLQKAYVSGSETDHNRARNVTGGADALEVEEPASLVFQPHWGQAESIELPAMNEGGHGGGDKRMLDDIFLGAGEDPLGRAATHVDGAYSILAGIAANQSMASGQVIHVGDVLGRPVL